MAERVLVIGAGMAGLWTALALSPTGRELVLLERDAPPPDGDADAAFVDWNRRGVGHLRHSHAFLARLRLIIRDQHPELLAELLEAGCRDLTFEGGLSDAQKAVYAPAPIDRDLAILTSRRTTLELIMRRYVARQPNVAIRSESFVKALKIAPGSTPRVTGVVVEDPSGTHELEADIVVDAAGRTSQAFDQLAAAGVVVPEDVEACGILYFTRHYRLNAGEPEPDRTRAPLTGDLEYLKFGVFPADNGCFSITLCIPEIEMELRKSIIDPAVFDAACAKLGGLGAWIDPAKSQPISRVFGMGDLHSRWRTMAKASQAAVLGFFPVGDSLVRTNPLYGRGCSFAAVSAHLLRDAITAIDDPAARVLLYQSATDRELRPYYDVMRNMDRDATRRARRTMDPTYKPSLRGKLTRSFIEDGVAVAVRSDIDLLRAALKGFHMLEHPQAWLKRPANVAKILGYWARGKARNADAYRPKGGPDRDVMLRDLGISPEIDVERVLAEAA